VAVGAHEVAVGAVVLGHGGAGIGDGGFHDGLARMGVVIRRRMAVLRARCLKDACIVVVGWVVV
jgi:hypothetical protein